MAEKSRRPQKRRPALRGPRYSLLTFAPPYSAEGSVAPNVRVSRGCARGIGPRNFLRMSSWFTAAHPPSSGRLIQPKSRSVVENDGIENPTTLKPSSANRSPMSNPPHRSAMRALNVSVVFSLGVSFIGSLSCRRSRQQGLLSAHLRRQEEGVAGYRRHSVNDS